MSIVKFVPPVAVILALLSVMGQALDAHASIIMPDRGVAAHRGAAHTHPENTMAAINEAIRLGAHQLEIDIQLTSDNHLVLMHDSTVTRTTNAATLFPGRGSYAVSSFTLEQLRQLDAGAWKGAAFAGEKIPTLEEAVAVVPANMWINLDIKGGYDVGKATALAVLNLGIEHQAFLSVSGDAVQGARDAMTDAGKTVLLNNMNRQSTHSQYITETIEGGFDFIQLRGDPFPDAADIQRLKDAGVRINYCCTDDSEQLLMWLQNGIEFPLVDDLGAAMEAISQIGIAPLQPIPEPTSALLLGGLSAMLLAPLRRNRRRVL